ncbi:MAG: YkvA family protein [Micromonosporaceae bacterium]
MLDVVLQLLLAVGVSLAACWLALMAVLLVVRPRGGVLTEAMRLLPDLVRLTVRLARDSSLPRGVRWRLGALGAYLALPIDLVPDFIPVLGYADDAILVVWTLRSVARRSGVAALRRHWPGTDDGFAALCGFCGLSTVEAV